MGNLMTANPRWVDPEALAWNAMKEMEADPSHPITVLPVITTDRTVVGIIKLHDIVQSGL